MDTKQVDSDKPSIFVVDDQPYYFALVERALGDFCVASPFVDGETALAAAASNPPNLMLLDVEMPGIDGYETCMRFKANPALADIPVIFLSVHDEIEDRLRGYEAGGQDYIIKPFNFQELKTKALHLLEQAKQRAALKSQIDSATSAAMLVMTSMSEVGVLLDAFRRFNACINWNDLVREVVSGAASYDLQAVASISYSGRKVMASWNGTVSPLEESVLVRMSEMGERFVEFKSRLSINYRHVSLLINNMPTDDVDLCGRLRDHLAMLVEGADVRAQAILAIQESDLRRAIESTVANITEALSVLDEDQRLHRLNFNAAVNAMRSNLEVALSKVSISDAQEKYVLDTMHQGVESLVLLQANELGYQQKLAAIIQNLKVLLGKQ